MIFIFGKHRWQPQILGYRNDYCLTCDRQQVCVLRKTNDFLHLYYVPVFPVGRSTHWHCLKCDSHSHERLKTGRGTKLVAAILASVFAAIFWVLPVDQADQFAFMCIAIGATIVGLLLWLSSLNHKPTATLPERLKDVPVLSPEFCLNCVAELPPLTDTCPDCEVEYFPTPVDKTN